MKRIFSIALAGALALSLCACGADEPDSTTAPPVPPSAAPSAAVSTAPSASQAESGSGQTSGSNILIVYFTADENREVDAVTSASLTTVDGVEKGRVRAVADMIQAVTGGELFVIQTDVGYPSDGGALIDYAAEEQSQNARPALTTHIENLEDYDTIFIGYPIWWGIAAWPVNDFVKNNDFTGKTVIPFCTSSSSGLGQSGELLAQMAGTGNWQTGMRFSSGASQSEVSGWISGLNLIPSTPNTNTPDTNTPDTGRSRVLVTYFSMPETTNPDNMTTEEDNSVVVINGQVLGNTQYMAQVIQETTGADIFRIEPVTPYPTDHTTLVALASQEQSSNARPAIQGGVDMDNYDVVFVGYPIWWSDMPMLMYTFFEQYDLSGKTIIPFSTHGGSSFAGTPATIQSLEPNARMLDGLTISRNNIQDARQEIVDWVNGLGLN